MTVVTLVHRLQVKNRENDVNGIVARLIARLAKSYYLVEPIPTETVHNEPHNLAKQASPCMQKVVGKESHMKWNDC